MDGAGADDVGRRAGGVVHHHRGGGGAGAVLHRVWGREGVVTGAWTAVCAVATRRVVA
ncbi:MAG: hypothetical protein U0Y82_04585 [Thermoleophilia bacterium]